jgi:ankyrin repeat protein
MEDDTFNDLLRILGDLNDAFEQDTGNDANASLFLERKLEYAAQTFGSDFLGQVRKTKWIKYRTNVNKGRWTLLHFVIQTAVDHPDEAKEKIRILLKFNNWANVEPIQALGTVLHYACDLGLYDIVELLLENIHPNHKLSRLNRQYQIGSEGKKFDGTIDYHTPLTIAIKYGIEQPESGGLNLIDLLLDHGADVNTVCQKKFTPLLWCVDTICSSENQNEYDISLKCLKVLLNNGANPTLGNVYGHKVVQYLVESLLDRKGEIDPFLTLHIDAFKEAVRLVLSKGAAPCPIVEFQKNIEFLTKYDGNQKDDALLFLFFSVSYSPKNINRTFPNVWYVW